jgi:ABC-type sulfate/molybdate transport systems ATPase subunit
MTEQDIIKYGEIQYLRGRLDELHKAFPTITNIERSRKLDVRIQKYFDKLKAIDEVAYHLYLIELETRRQSKRKSQERIKEMLTETLDHVVAEDLRDRIINQISKYEL